MDPKLLQAVQHQNTNASLFNDAASFVSFSSWGSEPIQNHNMMGGGSIAGGGSTYSGGKGKPSLDMQLNMLVETLAEKELGEQGDALRRFSRNNDAHSLNQFIGLLASVVNRKDDEWGNCANPFCSNKQTVVNMNESMKAKDREVAALRADLQRVKQENEELQGKMMQQSSNLQRQDSNVMVEDGKNNGQDGLYLKTTNTSASLNNLFDEESFDNAGGQFLSLEMSEDNGGFDNDVL
eukprot:TRINITY_DN357_c0_g1_i5.p1 TRINITY_DN357_c0_g1~~TRINITY_DN357_c0_g1_i5.p1  ORF type:complete len:237 (+),score=95.86 TRINITY_DN357_c0_g1_i5:210-920(+)